MKNISILLLYSVFLIASCSESATLPEVSILSPSNNSTSIKVLEGVVKTSAIEGTITQLNLYFDGDLLLSLENPNLEETFSLLIDKTPNRYKLKAEAIDDNGNIGYDEIDIQVEGYLNGVTGIYNGSVDIWSSGFAGSTSSLKDLRIAVTKSAIDSALNFSVTIDNETENRNNLRVNKRCLHYSSWGGGSNFGSLTFKFIKDSLSYRYQQAEGLGRTDGHNGKGVKQ